MDQPLKRHSRTTPTTLSQKTSEQFTLREIQLLDQLATGRKNREIAASLGCSVAAVEYHLTGFYRETGAAGRLALALWWRRHRPKAVA